MASEYDADRVIETIEWMREAAQSIAPLSGKVLTVYDQQDVLKGLPKGVVPPFCAVVYEGMRAVGETGSARTGASTEIVLSLLVVSTKEGLFGADVKLPTHVLLGKLRRQILGKKSPTGHYWRFMVEAPADPEGNLVFWVQRWATPLQLQTNAPR